MRRSPQCRLNEYRATGLVVLLVVAAAGAACADTTGQDAYVTERKAMLEEIRRSASHAAPYTGGEEIAPAVLDALGRVPRHEFVPAHARREAYDNRPLPIGAGQTISQPYIVALMTGLAALDADSVVLEIGTGSGYQAAVAAELAARVYSIEIVPQLGERARETLERLGYGNVEVRIGDGYAGWPEAAPFDAILVTAAPEEVPQPLLEQLAPGGRLVIPVGPHRGTQYLRVLTRAADGSYHTRDVIPVAFVPFTREE